MANVEDSLICVYKVHDLEKTLRNNWELRKARHKVLQSGERDIACEFLVFQCIRGMLNSGGCWASDDKELRKYHRDLLRRLYLETGEVLFFNDQLVGFRPSYVLKEGDLLYWFFNEGSNFFSADVPVLRSIYFKVPNRPATWYQKRETTMTVNWEWS